MPHFSPVLIAIAFATLVVALTALARRLPVPTPILQLGAGLAVGFIPGVHIPALDPDVVFFVFLPPILWAAAFFTSLRDFKANRRAIGLLAIGLVLATTAAVAIVSRMLIPGLPWAVAVVLGAIVSPPDAVAATAIVSSLQVPRRVITILEGESLVNDASALVLYRSAVVAAVTGVFSWGESIVRFFIDAGVGLFAGVLIAWVVIRVLRRTKDSMAETLLTIAAPYVAWVVAETLHVSAVLACVGGGLYVRQHVSTAIGPVSRLQQKIVWDLLVFLLNAMIFLILGAEFASLVKSVPPGTLGDILRDGLVIGVVVMVVRLAWVPVAAVVPRYLSAELRRREPAFSWRAVSLVAWTSMRGIVSLATALALPLTIASGAAFPYRSEVVLMTMAVIMMTLIVQGLTLKPLVRAMAFEPEQRHLDEERLARIEAARRGAEALEDLSREPWVDQRDVTVLRNELRERIRLHEHHGGNTHGRRRLRLGMIKEEQRMLVRLRNEGAISDDILRELEQELDLESVRVGG